MRQAINIRELFNTFTAFALSVLLVLLLPQIPLNAGQNIGHFPAYHQQEAGVDKRAAAADFYTVMSETRIRIDALKGVDQSAYEAYEYYRKGAYIGTFGAVNAAYALTGQRENVLRDDPLGLYVETGVYAAGQNMGGGALNGISAKELKAIRNGLDLQANGAPKGGERPTWQQSEKDVIAETGGSGQQFYKAGKNVPSGTKGSVRIDCVAGNCGIEVKNYNLSRDGGQSSLVRDASNSINKQADNIPSGMEQELVIDVRGQNVSAKTRNDIAQKISDRTGLDIADIRFKTE